MGGHIDANDTIVEGNKAPSLTGLVQTNYRYLKHLLVDLDMSFATKVLQQLAHVPKKGPLLCLSCH